LVRDIYQGSLGSEPTNLRVVNGTLFFVATRAINERTLWRSEGSEGGTTNIQNFSAGRSISDNDDLTVLDGTLFFVVRLGLNETELWRSDGTALGTSRVAPISSKPVYTPPTGLQAVGSTLFFSGWENGSGNELWQSDGTAEGTRLVQEIAPGAASADPTLIGLSSAGLLFAADSGTTGKELWLLPGPSPVARAAQSADRALVALNGSASQGEGLTYRWEQIEGPPIVLSSANAAQASFAPRAVGSYAFRLTISDSAGRSALTTVRLAVTQVADPPISELRLFLPLLRR
jgi:ELWxxDGT repeat protein